jgi:hypothetical protein
MDDSPQEEQRILWVSEQVGRVFKKPSCYDRDIAIVLTQLLTEAYEREVTGLVTGVIRYDGKIDLICAGEAYSVPLIASGVSARLKAMTDSWFSHPGDSLPTVDIIRDD